MFGTENEHWSQNNDAYINSNIYKYCTGWELYFLNRKMTQTFVITIMITVC